MLRIEPRSESERSARPGDCDLGFGRNRRVGGIEKSFESGEGRKAPTVAQEQLLAVPIEPLQVAERSIGRSAIADQFLLPLGGAQ